MVYNRDANRSGRPAGRITGRVDRPIKPVGIPVKFSFLATKNHLSTNRNINIYFITNKTFYEKSNMYCKPHLLKTLVALLQAVTNML